MRRYYCTGSTGFVGREIVRQLLLRDDTEKIMCLTRKIKPTQLQHPKISYVEGDILTHKFPDSIYSRKGIWYTDLIHGANEVNDTLQPDQHHYYYTIVEGTERIMKWAAMNDIPFERMLILSSGGVVRDTIYGRAKRQSERIAKFYGGNGKIARIYATVGPESPLNGQYAAGLFVGQAMRDGVIKYWGGTSVRTYIDISDCARWLLKILDDGPALKPVDVAGDKTILISDLAQLVGDVFRVPVVKIEGPDRSDAYIPDLTAATELGLKYTLNLRQSLEIIREHYLRRNENAVVS